LSDEDFLIPGVLIRVPQSTLLTGTRALPAEGAATPGEINLRIAAAPTKQNILRTIADTVTALIARLDEGTFRYRPWRTMGRRSG
jgi:hypothetical protein